MLLDKTLPSPPVLGEIQIWTTHLSSWSPLASNLEMMLSPREIRRRDRYQFPDKQQEFLISRGLLRMILSRFTATAPDQLEISLTEAGKPYLPGSEIKFSLSHSRGRIMYAFSCCKEVGIDIQEIYPISSLERIVRNYFSKAELEYLDQFQPDQRIERFFGIWTAKESYLKALGEGLRARVRAITILPDQEIPGAYTIHQGQDRTARKTWRVRTVKTAKGFRACAAFEGEMAAFRLIPFQPIHKASPVCLGHYQSKSESSSSSGTSNTESIGGSASLVIHSGMRSSAAVKPAP